MNKYCSFDGCPGIVRSKSLCSAHYLQLNRGQELKPLRKPPLNELCIFKGCEKPKHAQGYCQGHRRQITEGRELKPLRHVTVSVVGGRTKTGDGYVRIFLPNHPDSTRSGHILEHRLVMEEVLGRPLLKCETVHHKNGQRDDNRLENLELWVKPQPTGQRVSDLVEWMITNYESEIRKALL